MFEHEIVTVDSEEFPYKIIVHKNETAFIPRHWHRSFEISFTYKGQIAEFIINGHVFHPMSGDILIVNPNEIHSVQGGGKSSEQNIALTILIPSFFMKKMVSDAGYRYYHIPSKENLTASQKENYSFLQKYLSELIIYSEEHRPFSHLHIAALIYEIIYLLTNSFSELKENRTDLYTVSLEFDWIDQVLAYIRQHLNERLSVPSLAQHFYLNENYFARKFKKYMNMSVMKYVMELRLYEAHQLLTYHHMTLQAISDQCDFSNYKSFTSAFKSRYHMTPRDYRKKLEESQKIPKK